MKSKFRVALFAVPVLLGLAAFTFVGSRCAAYVSPDEGAEKKDKVILETMMRILRHTHYSPTDIDDDFSHQAFDLYLERNDYNKKIFLQADYDELKDKYYNDIDDQVKVQDFTFFNRTVEILSKRIAEDKRVYSAVLAKPFDFTVSESVELDPEKVAYAKDTAERV